MQRSNDIQNQELGELKRNVATMALRINQLERMLNGKEIDEAKVESGTVFHRKSRLSLSNGFIKPDWQSTDVTDDSGVTSIVAGTAISLSPATGLGDVTVTNAGVTSIVAGTNVTIDPLTGIGDVTINVNVGLSYDVVWVGVTPYYPPTKTTDFLQITKDGVCSWVGSMPATQPENAEVYDVSKIQIHLPGTTA